MTFSEPVIIGAALDRRTLLNEYYVYRIIEIALVANPERKDVIVKYSGLKFFVEFKKKDDELKAIVSTKEGLQLAYLFITED